MGSLHWLLHRSPDNAGSQTIQIGQFLAITLSSRISNGSLCASFFIQFFSYNFSIFFKPFISFPPLCKPAPVQCALYDFTLCDGQLALDPKALIESGCLLSAKSHDGKASLCSLLPNQLVKVHFHYCVLRYYYSALRKLLNSVQNQTCYISCL